MSSISGDDAVAKVTSLAVSASRKWRPSSLNQGRSDWEVMMRLFHQDAILDDDHLDRLVGAACKRPSVPTLRFSRPSPSPAQT